MVYIVIIFLILIIYVNSQKYKNKINNILTSYDNDILELGEEKDDLINNYNIKIKKLNKEIDFLKNEYEDKLRNLENINEKKINKIKREKEILNYKYKEINLNKKFFLNYITEIKENELGLYKKEFNYLDSEEYKNAIIENKEELKYLILVDKHISIIDNFNKIGLEYNYMKKIIDFTIKSFNCETTIIISKLKNSNSYNLLKEKINLQYEKINNLIFIFGFKISEDYLYLKIKELTLNYEKLLKIEEEKELLKEEKEKEKEERLRQEEIRKEQEKIEKEEIRKEKELEKLKETLKKDAENKKLLEKIKALETAIKELDLKKGRIKSQAELTKRGYIYIISNIGSFGRNVYKIGMTRRLDPMDRVKELGDASVPFIFDVHALIKSDNAPKLEKEFHRIFNKRRVNKVNYRKEFFYAKPEELENIIKKIVPKQDIAFKKEPDAFDYKETKLIEKKIKRTK